MRGVRFTEVEQRKEKRRKNLSDMLICILFCKKREKEKVAEGDPRPHDLIVGVVEGRGVRSLLGAGPDKGWRDVEGRVHPAEGVQHVVLDAGTHVLQKAGE